jgi:hypothetical protein
LDGGTGTFNPTRIECQCFLYSFLIENGTAVTLTWNIPDMDGSGPCVTTSDAMVITVNNSIPANAGADITICANNPVTLDARAATGGNWTGGAGTFNPNRNAANATIHRQ